MDTFAQGEIYARKINVAPECLIEFTEKDEHGAWIISHSESGHHHVIDAPGVTVMERTRDVPEGMRILIAIVENPTELRQHAGNAHEAHDLSEGVYEFRISREFDPFMQQARRVAD